MYSLRRKICEVGNRLWQQGMLPAGDGNISVRLEGNRFLITPSGVSKGFLEPRQVLVVDGSGHVLDGEGKPSSEILMHLVIYRLRGDVGAIVHAHPPFATAFASSNKTLPNDLVSEGVIKLGFVPTAPYAVPTTPQTAEAAAKALVENDAALLKNHGAVTVGRDLEQAYLRMELVEHIARVAILAEILNGYEKIPPQALEQLLAMRKLF